MDTSYLFDNAVSDKRLQIIKTALPYTCSREQKILSLFIIVEEFKNTMNFFSRQPDNEKIEIYSLSDDRRTSKNMIADIKKILSKSEQDKLDNFLNMINMLNMMSIYRNISNSPGKDIDATQTLKSMLSPEQQELFDIYSSMLTNGQATNAGTSQQNCF